MDAEEVKPKLVNGGLLQDNITDSQKVVSTFLK